MVIEVLSEMVILIAAVLSGVTLVKWIKGAPATRLPGLATELQDHWIRQPQAEMLFLPFLDPGLQNFQL